MLKSRLQNLVMINKELPVEWIPGVSGKACPGGPTWAVCSGAAGAANGGGGGCGADDSDVS